MVMIVNGKCTTCGKNFTATVGSGRPRSIECPECINKKRDIARKEHFGGLNALTIEERIRKIEEWIYDYKGSPLEIKL